MPKLTTKRGFTLIELLVVVAILGILVTISIAAFGGAQQKGRDSRRKSDLDALKKALELAKGDSTSAAYYPGCPGASTDCILDGGATPNADTTENPDIQSTTTTYIKKVPADPKNSGKYVYTYVPTSNGCTGVSEATPCTAFSLVACLENANDSQKDPTATADTTRCPITGPDTTGGSYTVTNI